MEEHRSGILPPYWKGLEEEDLIKAGILEKGELTSKEKPIWVGDKFFFPLLEIARREGDYKKELKNLEIDSEEKTKLEDLIEITLKGEEIGRFIDELLKDDIKEVKKKVMELRNFFPRVTNEEINEYLNRAEIVLRWVREKRIKKESAKTLIGNTHFDLEEMEKGLKGGFLKTA